MGATRKLRRDLHEIRVVFWRATHQPEIGRWEVAQQLGASFTKSRGEMPRAFTSRRKRKGVAAGRGILVGTGVCVLFLLCVWNSCNNSVCRARSSRRRSASYDGGLVCCRVGNAKVKCMPTIRIPEFHGVAVVLRT